MSMKLTSVLLTAMLCCSGGGALAQDTSAPERTVRITIAPGTEMAVPRMGPRAVVKNAPYSADVVTERQQLLVDGNQITQRKAARAYRDSAGRTREESLDDKREGQIIVIKDPDAGIQWTLNTQRKTARKAALPKGNGTAFFYVRPDGQPHVLERRIEKNGTVVTSMKPSAKGVAGDDKAGMRLEPDSDAPARTVSMFPQMGASLANAFSDIKWSRQANRRELPAREMDGVKATGQLRSYEIPAGEIGNRNAIVVSDESWYAPELKITLSSKHSDPRSGDAIFRIENLKREEPAASLFTVPADYTVSEALPEARSSGSKKAE